jgi:hypothetical protein
LKNPEQGTDMSILSRCWQRCALGLTAAMVFCACPSLAQTASPPPTLPALSATGSFEGISIGQPVAELRSKFGDPVFVTSYGTTVVWRYLTRGGGTFTDIIVKNNLVQSVTVVGRFDAVPFVDPNAVPFGSTPNQVRAKLGAARHESTNSDDGSLDLTYLVLPYGWVYEFHANKLDFIQLIAAQSYLGSFTPGPPVTTGDGTSAERAIWIRPSIVLANQIWIDTYLSHVSCGSGGKWKQASQVFQSDPATNDPTAYTLVHAQCTAGDDRRNFYFDTRGATSPAPTSSSNEVQFTGHDVATLLKATQDADTSPNITLRLLAKNPSEMPAYDPVAHFAGIDAASKAALIWMVQPYPSKTGDGAWALRSAMELACMATGFAGPRWKQIYDQLASQDAALPADAPNPYLNRLALTVRVRKIVESYLPQH